MLLRFCFSVTLFLCWTAISVAQQTDSQNQNHSRPNILYINADDLGVMDVGYNDSVFRTPNIDQLARQGMVFTNAYAPAANCAPSRACVHSGQWGPRHGVYTVGNSDRGNAATRKLIPIANQKLLPPETITLAEALKMGGYKTIHLGKYHIGSDPLQDGFDVNVGGDHNGSPAGGYYSPWNKSAMAKWTQAVKKDTHRIEVFADQAASFMQQHRDEPMFIHFSPYLVHTPLTAVPEYVDHYRDSGIDVRYGSMVEKLDEAIGVLLNTLARLNLEQSTMVVFSSDNGGIAAIHPQSPYRAGKGSYYEGGVREPMIMRWTGKIKAGSVTDQPVNTMDLYPTFLEIAQIEKPDGKILDGNSLAPLALGQPGWKPAPQYWHFPVYLQAYNGKKDDARDPLFRTRPGSAMRVGKWKLHEYFETGSIELYDLSQDPGERNNLAKSNPAKAKELHDQLIAWRQRVNAPVPKEPNSKYDADTEQLLIHKILSKSN